jgi:hypothetical protein
MLLFVVELGLHIDEAADGVVLQRSAARAVGHPPHTGGCHRRRHPEIPASTALLSRPPYSSVPNTGTTVI